MTDLRARIGLLAGPVVFVWMLLAPAPAGMTAPGWRVAAVGALMAIWWVSEAIPIPATSLLPLACFPLLGIATIDDAAAPYANPLIFLFLGGFLLALAMQRWNLHRRVALVVVRALGTRPPRLVGGFMIATAFVSMWVSNTATAVMMLPIGISLSEMVRDRQGGEDGSDANLAGALMLGIAYAASIGGFATLIGTPPNALLAGFARESYGVEVGFAQWMLVGVPVMLVVLPLTWLILTRLVFPLRGGEIAGGGELLDAEVRALGRMGRAEWMVAAVFLLAAAAWILRPLLERGLPEGVLSDAGIGITAALLLFVLPVDWNGGVFVLDWRVADRLPWDVLLLFGGGLSLADAITATSLAGWVGGAMGGLRAWPMPVLLVAVIAVVIVLSELASNTATAAAFLPVAGSLAVGIGENPLLLAVPAALAASCGFMLPVATPPNAIAYGTGRVSVPQMARAGLLLDVLCVLSILAAAYTVVPRAFGIERGVVPSWVPR